MQSAVFPFVRLRHHLAEDVEGQQLIKNAIGARLDGLQDVARGSPPPLPPITTRLVALREV